MEFVLVLGRILFGGFFVLSGINHFTQKKGMTGYARSKHIPSPELAVTLSGAILVASGLSVIFNIFFDIALIAIVAFLFITSVTMHAFWKDADPADKANNKIQLMKNFALLGASLMMLAWGF